MQFIDEMVRAGKESFAAAILLIVLEKLRERIRMVNGHRNEVPFLGDTVLPMII